ncbi:preprotein translocase subunit YajC [Mucilaginibacter yixingensis]|uniref:Sec translocon accessory complex subunit YajC n=1 Tax=Mucilaginibacter yixingensis TaxID=1295612 RepID=A0A2T5JFW8_9SPHI|nr:preprotein translocase subunit YajC [Mucilaginibacter yixingensis]PTR01318.1 preprotein translocase subunit YajC [Mucilaginibacter yixingensis]
MIATVLLQLGGGNMQGLLMMGLIILVFYFFMLRPQMKRQKDQKKYIEELKRGDKVITTAGIHGKIVDINESWFLIEIDNGVKVKFDKSAVSLEQSKALNAPAAEKKA